MPRAPSWDLNFGLKHCPPQAVLYECERWEPSLPTVEAGLDVIACLERVRAEDAEAARALVEYLYPLVARIVRTRLPRRLDEADLMQEIFMKMFAHLDAYQAAAPFEHWVSRIAVNTCLNHLRAEKSRPELRWADLPEEQLEALEAALSGPDEARPIDQLAARDLVQQLLATLSPEDRLVLELTELQDASIAEVQERLGWSSVRIRVRAFRARAKLRQMLKRFNQEGSL